MKKILFALIICIMTALSYTGATAHAATDEDIKAFNNQRTDAYALDYYKYGAYSDAPEIVATAKEITTGITNEYAKAQAISEWVHENMSYVYTTPSGLTGIDQWLYGVCGGYANLTMYLSQAAGIPAKVVGGYGNNNEIPHAWNLVYVDNRWVFVDAVQGYFDTSDMLQGYKQYSTSIIQQDYEAWTGSLYFYDIYNSVVVKEVKSFPIDGLVTETYGFNIKTLFLDNTCEQPFKLNKMKVNASNITIIVDYSKGTGFFGGYLKKVEFKIKDANGYTYDGNAYASVTDAKNPSYNYFGLTGNPSASGWTYFTTLNSTLKKPVDPVIKGYTFLGWYNSETGKKWDFANDKVKEGISLETRWQKANVKKYTVTFNSKNGSTVKAVTTTANSTITKPANPTRTGYKFAGWYKDYNCTKKWDFAKDKITANTTLYAGWKKI